MMRNVNLSQAILVVASQLFQEARSLGWTGTEAERQGKRSGGPTPARPPVRENDANAPARLDEQAVVVDEAVRLLTDTPYFQARMPEQVRVTLGAMLQRAAPSMQEVSVLRGMLNKAHWKIRNP